MQVLGRQKAKPNKIKAQPVRTAHTTVHHYDGTHYCSTETTSHLRCGPVQLREIKQAEYITINCGTNRHHYHIAKFQFLLLLLL